MCGASICRLNILICNHLEIGHFSRSAAARRPLLHLGSPVRASDGSPGQARAGAPRAALGERSNPLFRATASRGIAALTSSSTLPRRAPRAGTRHWTRLRSSDVRRRACSHPPCSRVSAAILRWTEDLTDTQEEQSAGAAVAFRSGKAKEAG